MSDTPLIRIVDDDPELLASQKMLLETLGWEVITYASGVEFLKHDELKQGGELNLSMDSVPNQQRGTQPADFPYSYSK